MTGELNKVALLTGSIDQAMDLKDELKRTSFAKGIAKLISRAPANDSVVIGVEGGWGEGKSYTIELIRREIEKKNEVSPEEQHIKWMVFNPWHFNNSEHLATLFLKDLACFLKQTAKLDKARWLIWIHKHIPWFVKLINFIAKPLFLKMFLVFIAVVLIVISLVIDAIKQAVGWTGGISLLIVSLTQILPKILSFRIVEGGQKNLLDLASLLNYYANMLEKYEANLSSKTLFELKKEVEKELTQDLPFSHIVVVVEDMDRLTPSAIRSMIQLTQMIADFPKIVYLVGYDREHVINALADMAGRYSSQHEARKFGEGYLQKAIHGAYQLPKTEDKAISNLFFNTLHEIALPIYGDGYNKTPYWQGLSGSLGKLITTPRVSERIINRALHLFLSLEDKSNPADVIIASYLMEYQPKLRDWLWVRRNSIASGGFKHIASSSKIEAGQAETDLYLHNQIAGDKETQDLVEKIIRACLPAFQSDYRHIPDILEKNTFRMSVPEFFEIYFNYEQNSAVQSPDISKDLIYALTDGDRLAVAEQIASFNEPMLEYVLSDIRAHSEKGELKWQSQSLPILKILGTKFDNHENVNSIFFLAITMINALQENDRKNAVVDLFTYWAGSDSKYLAIRLFEKIAMENGFISNEEGMIQNDHPLNISLELSELQKLKNELENKMAFWAHSDGEGSFLHHKKAAIMFFMWLRFSPTQARKKLDHWIDDDHHFLALLNTMMNYRWVTNNTGTHTYYDLSQYGLKKLMGMDGKQIREKGEDAITKVYYIAQNYPDLVKSIRELPDELPEG